jgi:hypothetical protein
MVSWVREWSPGASLCKDAIGAKCGLVCRRAVAESQRGDAAGRCETLCRVSHFSAGKRSSDRRLGRRR